MSLTGACATDSGPDISSDLLEAKTSCPAGKIAVCHYPPGNPGNAQSLCIGEAAVDTHLKQHEDDLGFCGGAAELPPAAEAGTCADLDSSVSVPSGEKSQSAKSGSSMSLKSGSVKESRHAAGAREYKSSGNSRSADGSRESHSDSNCDGDSDSSESHSAPSAKAKSKQGSKSGEGHKVGADSGQSGSQSSGSDNSDSLSLEFSGEDPDCVLSPPVDMPAVDCSCGNPGLSVTFFCSAVEVFACDGIDAITLVYGDGSEVSFAGVTGNTGLFMDETRAGLSLVEAYITSGGITQALSSDAAGCTNF